MPSPLVADLVIIGGGAAGMTAAVTAASLLSPQKKVLLLEHGPRVGKKLLSTGNGRCNLTNAKLSPARYHGHAPAFCKDILSKYPSSSTLSFFQKAGLLCREEGEGRVYPCSGQASSVLDILRQGLQEQQVEVLCDHHIKSIRFHTEQGFSLQGTIPIRTKKVILATGGKAAPASGSDGSGYALARSLGHSVTPLFPALCPVRTDPQLTRPMKGMRCSGRVTLLADGYPFRQETGEIQISDGALSGICVFQLSRYVGEFFTCQTVSGKPCREIALSLDLLTEYPQQELLSLLTSWAKQHPDWILEQFLSGILNKRVGQTLLKSLGIAPLSLPCRTLTYRHLQQIAASIKDWRFPLLGISAWNQAQVTAGGIPLQEFYPDTLESRSIPGLYAAGEILDVDGDCGGFNLQWAWCSGRLAGKSAADSLIHQRRKNRDKNF